MARQAFTVRIDRAVHEALKELSRVEGRPINHLLNDAIRAYLGTRGKRERELERTLAALRANRGRDPGFKQAVEAFVDAEASVREPIEGKPAEGRLVGGRLEPQGPVQREIRALLDA